MHIVDHDLSVYVHTTIYFGSSSRKECILAKAKNSKAKSTAAKKPGKPKAEKAGKADIGTITAEWKDKPKKKPVKKPARKPVKKTQKAKRPLWRRLARWSLIVLTILVLVPLLLGLLYRSPSVHPVSTLMIYERILGKRVKRDWVPITKIAPVLVQSVMMSEDGRYCAHDGVDWDAINMIIDDAMEGEKTRGASTITMQSVKNLFLWNSRSYLRKMLEVPLALYVDAIWSKQRQMEIYLNIVEWGPGIYGAEAAARHYFNRSAKRLNRHQAALLAVTLPNPHLRNPKKPSRRMKVLASINRRRAQQAGAYIGCLKR